MSFSGNQYPNNAEKVITTRGDIVRGSSTGARERYGIGAANTVLTSDGSDPSWAAAALAPTTTKGDISGFSTTQARIPISTNNYSLFADSAQALGLKWGASPTSVLSTTGDLLYASGANTLARLAGSTSGHVLTAQGAGVAPVYAAAAGDPNLAYIAEKQLAGSASYIEQTTGFDTYSNVMIYFNLSEAGVGTFIPMAQFYVGGSLQTGTSYGNSEVIDGASVSKTNGASSIFLDGNATGNNSCVGYMSLYTGSSQAPSDYTTVDGQFQQGIGSTSNAPDTIVQFSCKYTGVIQGIRFTETGTSGLFGTNSAIKMFGVTAV